MFEILESKLDAHLTYEDMGCAPIHRVVSKRYYFCQEFTIDLMRHLMLYKQSLIKDRIKAIISLDFAAGYRAMTQGLNSDDPKVSNASRVDHQHFIRYFKMDNSTIGLREICSWVPASCVTIKPVRAIAGVVVTGIADCFRYIGKCF